MRKHGITGVRFLTQVNSQVLIQSIWTWSPGWTKIFEDNSREVGIKPFAALFQGNGIRIVRRNSKGIHLGSIEERNHKQSMLAPNDGVPWGYPVRTRDSENRAGWVGTGTVLTFPTEELINPYKDAVEIPVLAPQFHTWGKWGPNRLSTWLHASS